MRCAATFRRPTPGSECNGATRDTLASLALVCDAALPPGTLSRAVQEQLRVAARLRHHARNICAVAGASAHGMHLDLPSTDLRHSGLRERRTSLRPRCRGNRWRAPKQLQRLVFRDVRSTRSASFAAATSRRRLASLPRAAASLRQPRRRTAPRPEATARRVAAAPRVKAPPLLAEPARVPLLPLPHRLGARGARQRRRRPRPRPPCAIRGLRAQRHAHAARRAQPRSSQRGARGAARSGRQPRLQASRPGGENECSPSRKSWTTGRAAGCASCQGRVGRPLDTQELRAHDRTGRQAVQDAFINTHK